MMECIMRAALLCLLLQIGLTPHAAAQTESAGGSFVVLVDPEVAGGTTIRAGKRVYRLFGIAAPETGTRCGPTGRTWSCREEARSVLAALIWSGPLVCRLVGQSRMQAGSVLCPFVGHDIATYLLLNGLAYTTVPTLPHYTVLQAEAQRRRLGLWSRDGHVR